MQTEILENLDPIEKKGLRRGGQPRQRSLEKIGFGKAQANVLKPIDMPAKPNKFDSEMIGWSLEGLFSKSRV